MPNLIAMNIPHGHIDSVDSSKATQSACLKAPGQINGARLFSQIDARYNGDLVGLNFYIESTAFVNRLVCRLLNTVNPNGIGTRRNIGDLDFTELAGDSCTAVNSLSVIDGDLNKTDSCGSTCRTTNSPRKLNCAIG